MFRCNLCCRLSHWMAFTRSMENKMPIRQHLVTFKIFSLCDLPRYVRRTFRNCRQRSYFAINFPQESPSHPIFLWKQLKLAWYQGKSNLILSSSTYPWTKLSWVWVSQSTIVETVHFYSNDLQFGSKRFTFVGPSTLDLTRLLIMYFQEEWYKKGGYKRNVKCECKNGQNGDPEWKKSCSWSFNGAPWSPSDVDTVQCKPASFQPPTSWPIGSNDIIFDGVTVYPHYEVKIDVKLEKNNYKTWSNLIAFHQNGVDAPSPHNIPVGARIPAVFVKAGTTKLFICSSINDNGSDCWLSEEMPVGEWFNLKIKECFQKPQITDQNVCEGGHPHVILTGF